MVFSKEVVQNERAMDNTLNIKTIGRNDKHSDRDKRPYEPTLYQVLDVLIQSGLLEKDDYLVDYGSGLGRVAIYLSSKISCHALGIEFVEELYQGANKNSQNASINHKASFLHMLAEEYQVKRTENRFFFANPFSVELLDIVMKNIFESYSVNPRCIRMYFHYMSDDYMNYLSSQSRLRESAVLDCSDFFIKCTGRENITVFEMR